MSWTPLKENYTDAVWSGLRKYSLIENSDDTISLQDVTVYSQKENSFYGALDANRTNAAINIIMAMLENGTDLYTNFQQYFALQQTLFGNSANQKLSGFDTYIDELESTADTKVDSLLNGYTTQISQFEATQEALFNQWFNYIKGELSDDVAGNLMNICTELDSRLSLVEHMTIQNDFSAPLLADDTAVTPTLLVDDLGNAIVADWKYKEV